MYVLRGILSLIALFVCVQAASAADDHHHVLDTSRDNMKVIAKSLGVKCTHCHLAKTPEGKPDFEAASRFKNTAIHMKVHFVDSLKTSDGESVTCVTCHSGNAKFLPRGTEKPATRLMEGKERPDIMRVMKGFTESLGVKCLFCHEKNDGGRMDPTIPTAHRTMARYMFETFTTFQRVDGSASNCGSCHQGKAEFLPRHEGEE
jgi:hypothetical protein